MGLIYCRYSLVMAQACQSVPAFLQLAAHPVRWRLLGELAAGDHRVRELATLVGQPQNLISYHLRLLRDGGLIRATRSSYDGRDSYYHLDLSRCTDMLAAAGLALHPALQLHPAELPADCDPSAAVLFVCTGNSARSVLAEALLRRHSGDRLRVISAGTRPKPDIHPSAVRVLRREYGIDITAQRPRPVDAEDITAYRYVITLCDKAREACPEFPEHPGHRHWSIPDPAGEDYPVFVNIAAEINDRTRFLYAGALRSLG